MRVVTVAAWFVLAFAADAVAGETMIGRWCDRMIPNMPEKNYVMTIVITNEGKVELRSNFRDGSSGKWELREEAGGIYKKVGSRWGDTYRIVPSTGNLQLLDNDGLIRIATRLGNTPKSKECSY